jgi:hypothetical protein
MTCILTTRNLYHVFTFEYSAATLKIDFSKPFITFLF